ncbi:MAG: peptidoglycan-binding domain-containing protein [Bacteroidota bacterium]
MLIILTTEAYCQDNATIKKAQKQLTELGYEPGPIDGVWGMKTENTLKMFQRDNYLSETGKLDKETLDKLTYLQSSGKGIKKGISTSKEFIIPFDVESAEETTTRGEMKFVKDSPSLLLFSLDCTGCKVEMPMTMNGSEPSIWTIGAEHIYNGDTILSNSKAELTSSEMAIGKGGRIIMVAKSGSVLTSNKVNNWAIKSDHSDPIVFKIVKNKGYVYLNGKGIVQSPEGKIYTFK